MAGKQNAIAQVARSVPRMQQVFATKSMCRTNHKLKNLENKRHFQAYHPFHPSANDVYLWFQITIHLIVIPFQGIPIWFRSLPGFQPLKEMWDYDSTEEDADQGFWMSIKDLGLPIGWF